MLIVSMRDRKVLRREADGLLVERADLSRLAPWHLNDMVVDHDGRAWVGNFGFDLMGVRRPTPPWSSALNPTARVRWRLTDSVSPTACAHPRRRYDDRGRINHEPA